MLILGLKRTIWRLRQRNQKSLHFQRLNDCWRQTHVNTAQRCNDTEFLVVDCETSSLDANQGELLSIGWVLIKKQRIQLEYAEQYLFKPQQTVGYSATIHQLRDCDFTEGLNSVEIMDRFLTAAAGRVLVFHHAAFDLSFLNPLSVQLFGAPLLMPVVDTLLIEQQQMQRRDQPIPSDGLRLAQCREYYGLPDYKGHDALIDAVSTAELLLAQIALKGRIVRLKSLC